MRVRALGGSMHVVALALAGAAALAAQEPTGSVDIRVEIDDRGTAHIEERYLVVPAPGTLELRALTRPCTRIEALRVEREGVEETPAGEANAPWTLYRLEAVPRAADTLRATVRYRVRLGAGDVDVPLAHLTQPIPQRDGEREGTVHLEVRFAGGDGSVRFPHLASAADGRWEARFVAIPSFVEVTHASAAREGEESCAGVEAATAADEAGDGGLTWRFLLFVGIMAAWVPLYLAWARRSGEGDA